jgi:glycine/serine hydroxymethyltransferase
MLTASTDKLEKLTSQEHHEGQFGVLAESDPEVYDLIIKEYERLQNKLQLIAAENL